MTLQDIIDFFASPREYTIEEWYALRRRIDAEFNREHGVSDEDLAYYAKEFAEMVYMATSDDRYKPAGY